MNIIIYNSLCEVKTQTIRAIPFCDIDAITSSGKTVFRHPQESLHLVQQAGVARTEKDLVSNYLNPTITNNDVIEVKGR